MTGGPEIPGHGPGCATPPRKDLPYFQERAEQEIRRAELADHPDAARAHYLLAGFYLDLVHNRAGTEPGRSRGAEGTQPPPSDQG